MVTPASLHRTDFERFCDNAFNTNAIPLNERGPHHSAAASITTHTAAASATPPEAQPGHQVDDVIYSSAEEVEIHNSLALFYEKHSTGLTRDAITHLVADRTRELHTMGESPLEVDRVFGTGINLNRLHSVARVATRAFPFAVASVAFDKIPLLSIFAYTAAELGLHAGLQAGVIDTFGIGLLERATANTHWFTATENQLEPAVRDMLMKNKPSDWQMSKEMGKAFQAYTVGNVLRLVATPTVTHFYGPEAGSNFDTWLTGARGIAAGGMVGGYLNEIDNKKGRIGPEYLLARTDWKEQYLALKNTNPYTAPIAGGLRRAIKLPLDIATDLPRAIAGVASAGCIFKSIGIGAGFSAVISGRTAVSTAMRSGGFNEASIAAMSHLTNIVLSAPVFSAVPPIEIMAGPVADKATSFLQETVPTALGNATDSAANWAARQIRQALNRTTNTLNENERLV